MQQTSLKLGGVSPPTTHCPDGDAEHAELQRRNGRPYAMTAEHDREHGERGKGDREIPTGIADGEMRSLSTTSLGSPRFRYAQLFRVAAPREGFWWED